MVLRRVMIFCLLSVFCVSIYAQDDRVLFFDDYVNDVVTQLPDIQINKLKPIQAEADYFKVLKAREWYFEMSSVAFQESDFTSNLDSPFLFSTGWEFSTSINKTFLNIGGRMNLDFTYRQFTAQGVVDGITEKKDFFVPILTFQYAQPLLKNAFGILDRLPVALAGLDTKITEWTIEEENSYLLSNYKKLYMQWVVYAQIEEFLLESLDNAEQLENLSREQRRTGYIDEVDFQNARMLVLSIKNELLDVDSVYTNLLYQISTISQDTNIKPDMQEWDILSESIQNNTLEPITFDDTRQALILEFMNKKLSHSISALRNSQLPELNAIASAAMEVYSTNVSGNQDDMILVPAYYAGVQFKYPFGDMDYRANSIELRKNRLEYDLLVRKYTSEFEYKMQEKTRNINFYREKIINRQAVREALQKRYNSQYRSFTQGRGTLAQLIDTRNEMLRTRIEEADVQLRLIYEYFDFKVMNNEDEIARGEIW